MTQPNQVPVTERDDVRAVDRLPTPAPWVPDRVAEVRSPGQPHGRLLGEQGPDQGYALTLAGGFEEHLELSPGESAHDAIDGAVGVAMARASLFGRAPVRADVELAFVVFGFLGEAPEDLVAARRGWFAGCAHDYGKRLAIAGRVRPSTLRMTPAGVRERLGGWQTLLRG